MATERLGYNIFAATFGIRRVQNWQAERLPYNPESKESHALY